MQVLILGAGYSGKAIAKELLPQASRITGTTRSPEKRDDLKGLGIEALLYDGQAISPELAAAMGTATHLIQSIAPGREGDPILRLGFERMRAMMPALEWVGYLSTVGVYGDHKGGWVDEDAECRPVSLRSRERVEAEDGWVAFGAAAGIPVAILRLAGIYGPGRNTFRNLAEGTAKRLIKPDQVFNRIRVEDIAGATAFLIGRHAGGIFNITDNEPAPPQDLVTLAADMMGVEPPPEVAFDDAELTPMARSFYGENKRVSNAKLRDAGYEMRFADYRASLSDLWQRDIWRG
ncbi:MULTISPECIES: SDR family oxidoreductase [unclassified Rhizobium]|uniref:SDR family oxidoreductase n=1 Tax=unclassified Rhizobium TaxID=2613769 RepID=UPI0006FE735F|nr:MULTISPECIES: SDR family oxidoreductase [unclassified Rhizobium]KQV44256.1 NAD(P)-dependent oxidoreductase [Rhizobium sp. Root1212]KRD38437.1 NAD(P)-dependent oxidoreductase [Rhizobium sp. Root268]